MVRASNLHLFVHVRQRQNILDVAFFGHPLFLRFGVGVQRANQTSQLCTYEFCMVVALQQVMGESLFSCLLAFK